MKKFIGLTLILAAVLLCFTMSVTASPSATHTSDEGRLPFEDVKSSYWFCDSLEFCYANGIIKGMNEYTFDFSGNLTRAQFVTMLAGLEGVDTSAYTVTKFTDVKSSHWYYGAVAWAYTEGIVNGMTEDTFVPNGALTRAQLATVMRSYMEDKYEVEVRDDALDGFTDKPKESYWYYDAMKYAVSAGLLSGNSDGTLAASGNVTRAQAVVILKNFMEKYFYGACEHSFSEANCIESSICSECGMKTGLPLGHIVDDSFKCNSDYKTECTRCTQPVSADSMPHDYVPATCGKPETCKYCSVTRRPATGKHIEFIEPTCTTPLTCKTCNTILSDFLIPHEWIAATCLTPKTCIWCRGTEGSPLSPNGQHTWLEATCVSPKRCKVCNKTEYTGINPNNHCWVEADCFEAKKCIYCRITQGKALGHTVETGVCKRCNTDVFDYFISHSFFNDDTNTYMEMKLYDSNPGNNVVSLVRLTRVISQIKGSNGKLSLHLTVEGHNAFVRVDPYGFSDMTTPFFFEWSIYDEFHNFIDSVVVETTCIDHTGRFIAEVRFPRDLKPGTYFMSIREHTIK